MRDTINESKLPTNHSCFFHIVSVITNSSPLIQNTYLQSSFIVTTIWSIYQTNLSFFTEPLRGMWRTDNRSILSMATIMHTYVICWALIKGVLSARASNSVKKNESFPLTKSSLP